VIQAHHDLWSAMLSRDRAQLAALLDEGYRLTHMTGYRQPAREWLDAVESGEMRYHAAREKSVTVEVTGSAAVLVGRSVVDATIYGARGTWNLQLTTQYRHVDGRWLAPNTVATTF
jgi:hypothetical protein